MCIGALAAGLRQRSVQEHFIYRTYRYIIYVARYVMKRALKLKTNYNSGEEVESLIAWLLAYQTQLDIKKYSLSIE